MASRTRSPGAPRKHQLTSLARTCVSFRQGLRPVASPEFQQLLGSGVSCEENVLM